MAVQKTAQEKLTKALADRDRFRDGWLLRGRELNALYDVINEVAGDQRNCDPVADLRALKAERDAIEQELVKTQDLLEQWMDAGRLQGA